MFLKPTLAPVNCFPFSHVSSCEYLKVESPLLPLEGSVLRKGTTMGGYNIGVKRQSLYKKGGENERNMMEMKVEFNLAKQMKMLQLKIFHLIQKAKDKERERY